MNAAGCEDLPLRSRRKRRHVCGALTIRIEEVLRRRTGKDDKTRRSVAQVDNLASLMQAPYHVRIFLIIAMSTAARKEAILELTWDLVDFRRGPSTSIAARSSRSSAPVTSRAARWST